MTSFTVALPTGSSISDLADWFETAMLAEHRGRLPRSDMRSRIRDALFVEETELDQQVDLLLQEVEQRKRKCPRGYPFRRTRRGIEQDKTVEASTYAFLLTICVSPHFRKAKAEEQDAAVLFEFVLLDALKSYLGPRADGRRFGWPPKEDRPTGFSEALDWLGEAIGLRPGPGYRPPEQNDGGLDVIVWRPFSDHKPAHLTVLGQAAIGSNWATKGADIVEDIWRGWLDFGRQPIKCLGIPYQVPDTLKYWDRLRRSVSVLLDRLRLSELVVEGELSHEEELVEWTERELERTLS